MSTQVPAVVPVIVAMPVPDTPEAPKFNGKEVERFIKKVQAHGKKAGIIDEDDLVDYLIEYCDRTRQQDLRYDLEFQSGKPNRTWKKATERLRLLYLALNEPEEVTYDDLKEYCQKSFFSGVFKTKTDIHNYAMGYRRIAYALINSQEITDLVSKQTFLTGLPRHLATYVAEKVPPANRKRSSPPSIEEVMAILYERLGKEALDWNPYEHAKRRITTKVKFEDEEEDSEEEPVKEKKSVNTKLASLTKRPTEMTEEDKYDALLRKMNEMHIAMTNVSRRPPSPGPSRPQSTDPD